MQIEGSANPATVKRVEDVIKEHYDETDLLLVSMNTTHVGNDEIYIVQIVLADESEDLYMIKCETLRVDVTHEINFTLLNEVGIDLTEDVYGE